jgi:peptide/nickel transport system substrate-binding protein
MRMTSRIACAVVVAMAIAGSAQAQRLRIGLNSDPDALDPTTSRTVAARVVFAALCDKLIDIDANLGFVPQLATEWAWAADGKTLTFKLRPGVKFQDGEAMNAAAVKYSLDRHLTMPGSNRKNELGPLQGVDAVDDGTVRLTLSEPFSPLVAVLADRVGMIVSPKAAKELGDKFSEHPVCAGAFKFVERVAQDRIVLERFTDYWNAKDVHFDKVTYLPIPDGAVRAANLRAGGLDIAETLQPADVPTLRSDPRVRVETGASLASVYIVINTSNGERSKTPLGQSAKVRQALELAIDRGVLNQVAFDGLFVPGNQSVPPGSPYYIKSLPIPARDVAKARALLSETGLDRVKIKLTVPNTTYYLQSSQVLQSMVAEAGFDLELNVVEVTTSLSQWTKGDFEALIILWSGRVDLDANLYGFNACDGTLNGSKYCNPEVDRYLKDARGVTDYENRYGAYEKATRMLLGDLPYIYLWHPALIYGVSEKIDGFRLMPDSLVRVVGLRLKP